MAATAPAEPAARPRHRPWGWIVLCAVLVAGLVGVGIWALSLNSDLDSQRDATAKAQQQAQQAQQQVDSVSAQVDDLSQQVSDAGARLQQAGADAQQTAQTAIDSVQGDIEGFKGKLDTLKTRVKDAVTAAEQSGGG